MEFELTTKSNGLRPVPFFLSHFSLFSMRNSDFIISHKFATGQWPLTNESDARKFYATLTLSTIAYLQVRAVDEFLCVIFDSLKKRFANQRHWGRVNVNPPKVALSFNRCNTSTVDCRLSYFSRCCFTHITQISVNTEQWRFLLTVKIVRSES